MSLVNIISAVGNNSSIYPLLVRDCGIEIPTKVALTYNQNIKDSKQMANNAMRERLIDEYGTSLVWLGGIPFMGMVADSFIKKAGYNPNISVELFNENTKQGLKYNIEKFKTSAPKEVKELQTIMQNKSLYEKLLAGKFAISTIIPVILMGYVLPKLNFALTSKLSQKQKLIKPLVDDTYDAERKLEIGENELSFKGIISSISRMSTVNKMALTDGGLTVGRVYTSRNKYEKCENLFKNTMMMFLNFVAPIWIAKGLDKFSAKQFDISMDLDPILLNDKKFLKEIKNKDFKIPKDNFIDFLDKNPTSYLSKLCVKYCGVKYLNNGVRDPRIFVDEKRIASFFKDIENFSQKSLSSGDVKKYAQKALCVKSLIIFLNVGISSFLLAYALPKLTFALRKKVTGSYSEPGLLSK